MQNIVWLLLLLKVANQEIIDIDSDDEFEKFDISTGVEAHVPWFTAPVQNKSTLAITETSFLQLQPSPGGGILKPEASHSLWPVDPQGTTYGATYSGGRTHSGGTSQASHMPFDSFLSGSHVHDASKAFPVNGYEFSVDSSETLKKFEQFKMFDIVEDFSDHHFVNDGTSTKKPSKNWLKRIQEEWKILEKDLPETILVRVYESRMDLLRAVIVGANGTPYHDGLFFFDVFFPNRYPHVPPRVHYHSGGLRINPNLYSDGKLCLSLLNTWISSREERWIPGKSTMLQVLVSIQGLVLNANPYFNEAEFMIIRQKPNWEMLSQQYNEETFKKSLQTMVFTLRKQPMHFENFVVGHFFKRAGDILVSCQAYMEGAQVGCLVRGDAFTEIGLKGCEKFIPAAIPGTITSNDLL
ncbi:(E3-independent) E2 ubiquitin-conjugating enzyme [Heracleum sosnowskyi]|uniref:E2 ubiquitin-conjugating enzyme n=1 Tax=Heracleum sosnowskyi TaxID=360622 RepID=A0AAD8IPK0_9APIA|nr:(E3-independent) E2 ubiquitin-conjugating enzyme [Heracleum sosnowskyi]